MEPTDQKQNRRVDALPRNSAIFTGFRRGRKAVTRHVSRRLLLQFVNASEAWIDWGHRTAIVSPSSQSRIGLWETTRRTCAQDKTDRK